MKRNLLILLCLWIAEFSLAQQPSAPFKWGKLSKQEAELSNAPNNAPAIVLGNYGFVKLDAFVKGPHYRFRQHRRVKVFRPEDFLQQKIRIHFFPVKEEEKLTNFKAQVIDASGKKRSIDKKTMILEPQADGSVVQIYPIPDLQPGSIIEYQYEIESRNVQQLRTWYFQENIPVLYSEYRVEKPENMDYAARWFGIDQNVEATYSKETPRLVEEGRNWGIDGDFKVYINTSRYVCQDIPAFLSDRCMSTPQDYRSGVKFYLKSIAYPDGTKKVYMNSWEEMSDALMEHARLGRQLTEDDQSRDLVAAAKPLFQTKESDAVKVKRMQGWLLEKVKWNDHYGIYTTGSLDEAFNNGQTNSGTRNLMLLKLMRSAGMKAWPILVSTRENGKVGQQYPLASQFNHLMIYWQKTADNYQVLDVSEALLPVGFPRSNALNGDGWLLDAKKGRWVDLQPASAADIYLVTAELKPDGSCEASVKATYTGYAAYKHRIADTKAHWTQMLDRQNDGFTVKKIRTKNDKDIAVPFKEYITCERPAVKSTTGQVEVRPIMFSQFMKPYPKDVRPYPVDLMYPVQEQYIFILRVPDGYEVAQLPEASVGNLADGGGLFLFDSMQRNGVIQVVSKIQINQLKFTPEEYPGVHDFSALILEKFSEAIVLKKIENN